MQENSGHSVSTRGAVASSKPDYSCKLREIARTCKDSHANRSTSWSTCDFFKPRDAAILKPHSREGSGIINILITFPCGSPVMFHDLPLVNASGSWRTGKAFDGIHTIRPFKKQNREKGSISRSGETERRRPVRWGKAVCKCVLMM